MTSDPLTVMVALLYGYGFVYSQDAGNMTSDPLTAMVVLLYGYIYVFTGC